jgi:hypothetical protein
MHVFDCRHVDGHLGEEGEGGLLISFEGEERELAKITDANGRRPY